MSGLADRSLISGRCLRGSRFLLQPTTNDKIQYFRLEISLLFFIQAMH